MRDRRAFLAGVAAMMVTPHAAEAQQAGKAYRVGVIASTTSLAELAHHPGVTAFVERLAGLGWTDGRNVRIERRTSMGRAESFGPLVAELVGLGVDAIVVVSQAGAVAARKVTATTPIIMVTSARPVEAGLARSLGRPGGNVTGHTLIADPREEGKRLQLLKETIPEASHVGYLAPSWTWTDPQGQEARNAANALGLNLTFIAVQKPEEYSAAFDRIRRLRPDALYAFGSAENFAHRRLLLEFASRERFPTIYAYRDVVEEGGLISYGASVVDLWRGAAGYTDKILRGANEI